MGVDWPYPDLKSDECIIASNTASEFSLVVGDRFTLVVSVTNLWTSTAMIYNDYVKSSTDIAVDYSYFGDEDYTLVECTIAGIIDTKDGLGKFPTWGLVG